MALQQGQMLASLLFSSHKSRNLVCCDENVQNHSIFAKDSIPLYSSIEISYSRLHGKTMLYSFRLPGFGRTDCTDYWRKIAGKYYWYAYTDALAEAEGRQVGVGAWINRFPHR